MKNYGDILGMAHDAEADTNKKKGWFCLAALVAMTDILEAEGRIDEFDQEWHAIKHQQKQCPIEDTCEIRKKTLARITREKGQKAEQKTHIEQLALL
ncbi:MAG: hypothetical protein RBT34_04405 [Anaerolineaceae bacterium]|jgi:hypothetical protein|nr:hypothetical protein [Anaerolineaceae bacterium]